MALAVSDLDELRSYLWSLTPSRPQSFTLEGSRTFSLSSHLDEIEQILYGSGLTGFRWGMQGKRLQIQNCTYAPSFALCSDEEEIRVYLSELKQDRLSEGMLCLTPDLYAALSANDFSLTYRLLALSGLSSTSLSYNGQTTIGLMGLSTLGTPVYQIDVESDLTLAFSALYPTNACTLVFSPDVYRSISQNGFKKLGEYTARAGITSYSYVYSDVSCVMTLSSLLWADSQGYSADTEEALVQLLSELGRQKTRDFRLILSAGLYDRFLHRDPSLFRSMLSAGFLVQQYSYSDSGRTLYFQDVDWSVSGCPVYSLDDVIELLQKVPGSEGTLALICENDLFVSLTQERIFRSGTVSSLLRTLMISAGLYGGVSIDDELQTIYFPANERYVGVTIASMVAAGREMELTGTQQNVLQKARELLGKIDSSRYARCTSSDARTVCGILDQLSQAIDYETVPGNTDHDNAAGALLRGRADCDGYADSFYLLCSLAGIPVMLQHGDSLLPAQAASQEVTHVWNLVSVGGLWYMTDPTFCDSGNTADFSYVFLGRDLAGRLYDTFIVPVPLADETLLESLPFPAYTVTSTEDAVLRVREGLEQARQCYLYFTDGTDPGTALIQAVSDAIAGENRPRSYIRRPEIHQYIFTR